ncbi:hypothetical protein HMF8227_00377 [Saliniradius amylolyticus]|uniref:Short-chain dehydrogenase n=1 Tax=Saliniradius amylolyticus TaxID=2183582 RepID=A0A2S2DZU6_9ALTE|nr:SDR family NAD(P)-dependent oxidoreductase [Saliniradius amylolyticus]AWL10883.1 hypothetical protein HMF8227_00377 [Saliniradius amylolyticus]
MSSALVIGASGGIGQALVARLLKAESYERIFTVSRRDVAMSDERVISSIFDTSDEEQIKAYCAQLKSQGAELTLAVCCVGVLHDEYVFPEKKLEEIKAGVLNHYFNVNAITPMLWVSHLVGLFPFKDSAVMAALSARVGSIGDNRLGGWYGYRASKAALNMLVKSAQIEYRRRAKGTALLAYHPGTVNTNLSEPFQAGVPQEKLFTPEFTARQLLEIAKGLDAEQGPFYLDWQGKPIEW